MGKGGALMLWKIMAGALAMSLAFGGWQMKRGEALKVEVARAAGQIAALQGNLADVLQDRMRDEEIERLTDAEKLDLAVTRGWLRDTVDP